MRKHLSNALYGALDYASYPLGMLAAAPVVLHKLGAAEYGLWMVSTAVVSAGGIVASGVSDAGMQRIASLRGGKQTDAVAATIRTLLAINLALGCAVALAAWIAGPYAARHIAAGRGVSFGECLLCIRIASILILIRSAEAAFVTAQRAFEEYGGTVRISTAVRLVTLAMAAVLAFAQMRTESIMLATAVIAAVGMGLQYRHLGRLMGGARLWPALRRDETGLLLRTGVFVWMQAAGSVLFRQFDRILLGVSLGAAAVAPYSACIQFAEPLFGLTASGLSFFFPYLSGRAGVLSGSALRRPILKAFGGNLLLVLGGAGLLLLFGGRVLQVWAGPEVAHRASPLFPWIVLSSALSGLSVTGVYAMQALQRFRAVAGISLGSRCGLLVLTLYLLKHRGVDGLVLGRVLYGAAALLVYVPLAGALSRSRGGADRAAASPIVQGMAGGSES